MTNNLHKILVIAVFILGFIILGPSFSNQTLALGSCPNVIPTPPLIPGSYGCPAAQQCIWQTCGQGPSCLYSGSSGACAYLCSPLSCCDWATQTEWEVHESVFGGLCDVNGNGKIEGTETQSCGTNECSYPVVTASSDCDCIEKGGPSPTLPPPTPPPPGLSVVLTATPNNGFSPLNTILSADVSGETGPIDYWFWWNCTNTSANLSTSTSQCGAVPNPPLGDCQTGKNGFACTDVNADPQTVARTYSPAGTYTAKVLVRRGSSMAADNKPITVTTQGPPSVGTVTIVEPDYCVSGAAAFINWTYSDPDGNPQSAYQVQVDPQGSSFNPPEVDSGKVISSGTSYFASGLDFNLTYKARVKVWDSFDLVSDWTTSFSWKTPSHAYPLVNFSWLPLIPIANQPVQFTGLTTFYDSGGIGARAWSWLFGDGVSSAVQNPAHTYTSAGSYSATETVTDKDGFICSLTKLLNVEKPIPVWKEVSPK